MKRVLLTLVWTLTATVLCSAQTFYYPHVANGVLGSTVWRTTIFLTNPASTGIAGGSVTFFRDDPNSGAAGTAYDINFTDENGAPAGSGNTVSFQMGPGETRKYVSSGTGDYAGGFATVSSSIPINGTAVFSQFDPAGRLIGEAGVPGGSAVSRQAIFVDTLGGYNIGIGYANPGASATDVTLTLLNSSAVPIMMTTQSLGALNHGALFVTQLFPGAPSLSGTMQISSASPITAIALRFDPTFSIFTTLPPVTIASLLNPAVEWLLQRPWLTPLTSLAKLLGSLQLRIG